MPRIKLQRLDPSAFPILRYNFDNINWRLEEIRKSDTKTRKVLTIYKMNHQEADVDKLYVKKEKRCRVLLQI
jgi:hypothetical protein